MSIKRTFKIETPYNGFATPNRKSDDPITILFRCCSEQHYDGFCYPESHFIQNTKQNDTFLKAKNIIVLKWNLVCILQRSTFEGPEVL